MTKVPTRSRSQTCDVIHKPYSTETRSHSSLLSYRGLFDCWRHIPAEGEPIGRTTPTTTFLTENKSLYLHRRTDRIGTDSNSLTLDRSTFNSRLNLYNSPLLNIPLRATICNNALHFAPFDR